MTTAAAIVIFLSVAVLITGCARENATGGIVVKIGDDLQESGKDDNSNSDVGQESQEWCTVEGGILNGIFSGHGSL
ncbi:MAG: hypothetical protein AABX69_02745 [Nanoarchaeota archaeon]